MITYYLKYMKGSVFTNVSISSLSESAAYIVSGLFLGRIGTKRSFIVFFGMAAVAGTLLGISESAENTFLIAIFVLFAKFGISASFNIVYLATMELFPPSILGTAFGISNIVARFSTVFAPMVVEMPEPVPMVSFVVLSVLAAVFTMKLKMKRAS